MLLMQVEEVIFETIHPTENKCVLAWTMFPFERLIIDGKKNPLIHCEFPGPKFTYSEGEKPLQYAENHARHKVHALFLDIHHKGTDPKNHPDVLVLRFLNRFYRECHLGPDA